MSRISGQSSQVTKLQNTIKVSMADKNLDKHELKELKQMLKDTPGLSPETKAGVLEFLNEARSDSKGFFFGLFGKGISNKEMGALKDLAKSQGNNPVLSGLVQELEGHQAQARTQSAQRSTNTARPLATAPFDPASRSFPTRQGSAAPASGRAGSASPVTGARGPATSGSSKDFDKFYVTQNKTGLRSAGGDCGPATAAMVAKRFGFLNNVSNRDAVQTARNASGVTSKRGNYWAISESEVTKSIQGMTGGKVREVAHQNFKQGNARGVIDMLRKQIDNGAMPILETGSPYKNADKSTGRHFMVVMDVKQDGTLVLADPGGNRQWEMSPERLAQEMVQADRGRDGTHVMAYNDKF